MTDQRGRLALCWRTCRLFLVSWSSVLSASEGVMAINATRQFMRLLAVYWLTMLIFIPLGIVPTAAESSQEIKGVMLQVSDMVFEESGHHDQFTYTVEFRDINGHDAILRYSGVCFGSGGYISVPVKYLIEPSSALNQEGQLFMPMANSKNFGFIYTGDNGEGDDITIKVRAFAPRGPFGTPGSRIVQGPKLSGQITT